MERARREAREGDEGGRSDVSPVPKESHRNRCANRANEKKIFVGELLAAGFAGAQTVFPAKNSALFAASHAGRRRTSHRLFRMPICMRIDLVTN